MSLLGFKYFKVPDAMDYTCDLANELLFTKDIKKILKHVYSDVVLEELPMDNVKMLLEQMTIERVKVVFNGLNLLHKEFGELQAKTEKWFKTKYTIAPK